MSNDAFARPKLSHTCAAQCAAFVLLSLALRAVPREQVRRQGLKGRERRIALVALVVPAAAVRMSGGGLTPLWLMQRVPNTNQSLTKNRPVVGPIMHTPLSQAIGKVLQNPVRERDQGLQPGQIITQKPKP